MRMPCDHVHCNSEETPFITKIPRDRCLFGNFGGNCIFNPRRLDCVHSCVHPISLDDVADSFLFTEGGRTSHFQFNASKSDRLRLQVANRSCHEYHALPSMVDQCLGTQNTYSCNWVLQKPTITQEFLSIVWFVSTRQHRSQRSRNSEPRSSCIQSNTFTFTKIILFRTTTWIWKSSENKTEPLIDTTWGSSFLYKSTKAAIPGRAVLARFEKMTGIKRPHVCTSMEFTLFYSIIRIFRSVTSYPHPYDFACRSIWSC